MNESAGNENRRGGIGPGERLQAARIQKGLSVDDVATRMHLSNNILEAIEENNFEEITAPIFVKGYLRAYARIVELDEDDMIEQYIQYYSEEDPPISSISNTVPELSVADARIRWMTYLVIVVLVLLLGVWWWNKEQKEDSPISLDSQGQESEIAITEIEQAPPQVEVTPDSESVAVTSEPVPEAEAEMAAAVEPEALPELVPEPEVVSGPETEDQPAESEPGELSAAMVESESGPVEPVEITEPVLLAPTGSDKLVIIVNADTWADIKDGSGYQMVYDLLRAHQLQRLIGAQ